VNFSTLNLSVKFTDSSVVNSIAIVDTGVHDDISDDRAHLSYGDLQLLSSRLAAHIAAAALVRDPATVKSRKIAAFTRSNTSFVVSMLAAWRLNAVFVPLSASHSEQEIRYIVRDSGASIVCGSAISRLHNFDVTKNEDILAIETDDIIMSYLKNSSERQEVRRNASAGFLNVDSSLEHPAADEGSLVIYTSGTTGLPKGVLHTHRSLHAMVTALVTAWEYSPRDRILHFLPLHHVHGLVNKLLCVLYAGGTVEFLSSAAPAVIWDRLKKEELLHLSHVATLNDASTPRSAGTAIQSTESTVAFKPLTLLMGVPTVYARLLEHANTVASDDPGMLLAVSALSRFRLMVLLSHYILYCTELHHLVSSYLSICCCVCCRYAEVQPFRIMS
jgi:acyl-CoA synthetase (AMP-forming)/AMP-acid ligase II